MKACLLALLCSGCVTYTVATDELSAKKFAAFSAFDVGLPALIAIAPLSDDRGPMSYPFRYLLWGGTFFILDGIVALIYHCREPGECKD